MHEWANEVERMERLLNPSDKEQAQRPVAMGGHRSTMTYVAQLEIDVGVLRGPEADPDGVAQALVC